MNLKLFSLSTFFFLALINSVFGQRPGPDLKINCPKEVRANGSIYLQKSIYRSQVAGKWFNGQKAFYEAAQLLEKPVISTDGFKIEDMQVYQDLTLTGEAVKAGLLRCTYSVDGDSGQRLILSKPLYK